MVGLGMIWKACITRYISFCASGKILYVKLFDEITVPHRTSSKKSWYRQHAYNLQPVLFQSMLFTAYPIRLWAAILKHKTTSIKPRKPSTIRFFQRSFRTFARPWFHTSGKMRNWSWKYDLTPPSIRMYLNIPRIHNGWPVFTAPNGTWSFWER